MRIANVSGRVKLLVAAEAVDVEAAIDDRFSADPLKTYEHFAGIVRLGNAVTIPSEIQRAPTARPAAIHRKLRHLGSSSRDSKTDERAEDPVERRPNLNDETPLQG